MPISKAQTTKSPATKTATSKAKKDAVGSAPLKRKHDANEDIKGNKKARKDSSASEEDSSKQTARPVKKAVAPTNRKGKRSGPQRLAINAAPTERLKVFVCGNNEQGELGLGASAGSKPVRRPRLNPNLIASDVGVVQLACGGMHSAALTANNEILTWGINDSGALGRDTEWNGGLVNKKEKDDSDSDDESEVLMNPKEAKPTIVDTSFFEEDTVFTQVACGDNATFAVTSLGDVWGWGTFKSGDGKDGFAPDVTKQRRPMKIPGLTKIKKVAVGSNHAVALNAAGGVLAWGFGEQNQLARRLTDRTRLHGLSPSPVGLRKDIIDIGAGADHSFAIHKDGTVFGWGLNNYCQTGIDDRDQEDFANILRPQAIDSLKRFGKIVQIDGGNHHSVAVSDKGECLAWGRLDTFATGLDINSLPGEDTVKDARNQPRILTAAYQIAVPDAVYVAAGSDHSLAVNKFGKAYSWGFSVNCQTGQGTDEDIKQAAMIDNTAVREQKLVWAGAGGQFSVLAGLDSIQITNGHS